MNKLTYHPEFGEHLPNRNLLIPTSWRSEDGEIVDGNIEVNPEHPHYAKWLKTIEGKDAYLKEIRENVRRARRRGKSKAHEQC